MEKSSHKKILIITYYWPPAGGPGVQRWLKFAKYLPEFGWEPIIYTPENPSYPLLDESLLKDVPKNIKVVKTNIWEPYQIAEKLSKNNKKFKGGQFDVGQNQSWKSKLSIWIRGNFFIPDARVFWVKPSIQFLTKYIQEHQIETIVTTGPPHSMHLIGLGLKEKFNNLQWIADFRDPWTEISYYKHLKLTKSSDKKHRTLEKSVFKNADITLATSYTDAENFKKAGANAVCITNGFDESEIENSKPSSHSNFVMSYVGVLEQLRNPEILWEALSEMKLEDDNFRKDFRLKFVGRIDEQILNRLEQLQLQETIINKGYLKHDEALQEMQTSDILLMTNFPNDSSKGIIPGKIFEYLATGKKILSFGPEGADVSEILKQTKAGKHFGYSEKKELKDYLQQIYQDWKNGNLKTETENINDFSRKNLTQKLVEIL